MFGHHHHHHHEEPPATWKDGIVLKVVNVAVFFLFLGANAYAFSLPSDGAKETYLTPAAWIYYVWTVVHFLLLGAIVYQFTPAGKKAIIDGISWRLPLLGVLNAIYVNLAARRLYIGAFIMLLFVSGAVTHIYFVIKKYHGPQSLGDELFVHLPFSLYHGWTAVLIMVTTFEAFGVNAATHEAGVWTKLFVFLALLFLDMTVGTYSFGSKEGDLPGAIVICLGLFAIFAHQTNGFIHWSALVFAILSLFGVLKAIWGIKIKITGGYIRVEDAERGPLIGHHAVGGHHHGH